jgi:2-amino-4-hydroxy-6-hydroxymethyldihydropteridine diphosphokinase
VLIKAPAIPAKRRNINPKKTINANNAARTVLKKLFTSNGLEDENKELYIPMTNQFTNKAYLLMGGNVGERITNLNAAAAAISESCGKILTKSKVYETAAWGNENQPNFLNQLLVIETRLLPIDLLNQILNIESELGRKRDVPNDPRTIDIDILYYNDLVLKSAALTIPHPRIGKRRFSLVPLMEIAPDLVDPDLNLSIREMYERCDDLLAVNPFQPDVKKNAS